MSSPTKAASSRSFGILVGVVFVVIAAFSYKNGTSNYPMWTSLGALFFVVALLVPRLLRPVKGLWLRLGGLLARILSPVVLTLIYVISVVPIGVLLKIFGKDSLRLMRDPKSTTYWILRRPPGPSPESLKLQF